MLFINAPKDWKNLQLVTKQLFDEINCRSEVDKNINTIRGKVCIDVYITDFVSSPPLIYLCECKYWKAKVPKSVVHSFRSVIHDSGANRGYIISKAGFQRGALEAATSSSVELVTWEQLQVLFKDRWISALRHKINSTAEQINSLLRQGVKTPHGMTKEKMYDYMCALLFRIAGLTVAACSLSFDEIKDFPWKFTDCRTNYLKEKRLMSVNSWREYFNYIIPLCEGILADVQRVTTKN